MAVVHYPITRPTNVVTGGVRLGLCAEGKEEMKPLEKMETRRRWGGWREWILGGSVPRRGSRLYTYALSTTSTTCTTSTSRTGTHTPAHQIHPSTPVDAYSRSLRTRRHGKQPARMVDALQYRYYPGLPSSPPTVCAVSTPTPPSPAPYIRTRPPHSHRSATPLHTLTRSSCPRVHTRDMVHRRLGMHTSPFQMQMPNLMDMYTSYLLQLLHFLFPTLFAAPPCFELVFFTSRPTRTTHGGHSTRPRASIDSQRTRSYRTTHIPVHSAPSAMGKGRELDWTKLSATIVDLRAARGAIPAHIPR